MMYFSKVRERVADAERLPRHIAMIMDGNGRWAKERGLPRPMGHRAGVCAFKDIACYCNELCVEYLTVYTLSTENWSRPAQELEGILGLLREYLKEAPNYREKNIRLQFIGNRCALDEDIRRMMDQCEQAMETASGLIVNLAVNYGGRDDILRGVKRLVPVAQDGRLIDEEVLSKYLYTKNIPDPELLIRPSGECRLSNFLLWQCAHSECVFMDVLWPDFQRKHLDQALMRYANRKRRFEEAADSGE